MNIPDRYSTNRSVICSSGSGFSSIPPRACGGVIEIFRIAEEGFAGFQRIDLIERPHDRVDETGVVPVVRNRLRKRLPQV